MSKHLACQLYLEEDRLLRKSERGHKENYLRLLTTVSLTKTKDQVCLNQSDTAVTRNELCVCACWGYQQQHL